MTDRPLIQIERALVSGMVALVLGRQSGAQPSLAGRVNRLLVHMREMDKAVQLQIAEGPIASLVFAADQYLDLLDAAATSKSRETQIALSRLHNLLLRYFVERSEVAASGLGIRYREAEPLSDAS